MSVLGKLFNRKGNKDRQLDYESASDAVDMETTVDTAEALEDEVEYEVVEREIAPARIICPDCGGITLEGLEFCDKCGGELQ